VYAAAGRSCWVTMTAALDRPTTGLIDVAEARRRATNSEHYAGSRSPEAVRAWVRRRTIVVDGRSFVDTACHAAFSELKARDVMADTVASLPQSKRDEVVCKLRAIQDFAAFMGGAGRTLGRDAGRKRFVRERKRSFTYRDDGRERVLRLSCRSLRRWAELYGNGGLDALARDGRGRWDRDNVSADAVALYWSTCQRRWYDAFRHSLRRCAHKSQGDARSASASSRNAFDSSPPIINTRRRFRAARASAVWPSC